MERRENLEMAMTVHRGILLDTAYGVIRSWAFMSMKGVPQRIVERVLGEPAACRLEDRLARERSVKLRPPPGPRG